MSVLSLMICLTVLVRNCQPIRKEMLILKINLEEKVNINTALLGEFISVLNQCHYSANCNEENRHSLNKQDAHYHEKANSKEPNY